jgi:hypothetical protein
VLIVRWILKISAIAALGFACVTAQAAEPDWGNVVALSSGSEIRVVLAGGRTVRGFLQSATQESLALNAATSQETLPRVDVKRVQMKRPGHRGRNTLIGLGVGSAAGLATGAGIDASTNGDWFPNFGKAVFTPLGAIIGTVIGVAIPTGGWHDVYRVR